MLNNVTKCVSIVGCGWLGLPLGKFLSSKGYKIKGSTTRIEKLESLKTVNIVPYLVHLNPAISGNNVEEFFDSDLIIINLPPGRNPLVDDYVQKMNFLNDAINKSGITKVIFISSTSVYPELNNWVDEDTGIDTQSVKALRMFAAEQVFVNNPNLQTTVIRMAGLIGPNRHPGRFFAHKQNIANGLAPVNLIHLEDCMGLINAVIENNFWGKTINGVSPSHPLKQDFYALASLKYNGSSTSFIPQEGNYKKVCSKVTFEDLGYKFKIGDLTEWLVGSS
jgi:nucleoside-diphosphate-sugar epimerase